MAPILMSFRLSRLYSVVKKVVPAVRWTGIGFVLAVLLSMFLALAAQAQTDSGSSSSTVPTLTIASSHVVAASSEEITFTVSASSAPSSALPVSVHVRAQGLSMDTRTVADVVLPAGATTVTLRLEQVAESIAESRVDVTLALAAGTGYSLGDASTARVSIYYPPATVPESGIESSPTPTPSASPPDAPSGVQVSATATDNYTVTWTAEAGETYRLEREAAYLFSYRVWQTVVDNLSVGSFTDDGLPCGLFYLYQVQAKVAGSAFGSGAAVVGSPQSCASTTSGGARTVRAAGTPVPRLRVVTDNPDSDRIQIRLLFFGPQGNEEQYRPTSGLDEFQADRSQRVPSGANAVWPNPESPGNSKYRWEESSPEFFWTGLACGADYFFRGRGNGNGTLYRDEWGPWTDDAHADPQHGSRSPVHGSTRGCTALTPPKLTNLTIGSATETSLVARWGLPPLPLGLVNFNLRYRPNEDPNSWINVRDDLNRTELSGTEFIVMGLLCSAGYKFQISAAGNGGIYSLDYGEWSDQVDGSTARCSRLAKPELDVIPRFEGNFRQVQISWKPVRLAEQYVVQAREHQSGDGGWSTRSPTNSTTFDFLLESIANGKGLDDPPYAFQVRVKAVDDSQSSPIPDSDYSDTVIVIDTPITQANGNSPSGGQATLTWIDIEELVIQGNRVLGDAYSGGWYTFRIRNFSVDKDGNHHTGLDWKPDNPVYVKTTPVDGSYRIIGLVPRDVYGIQLIYEVTKTGETTRVYAARDAYVWPSNQRPDDGDRVATYPLSNPRKDKTYSYRICESSFSLDPNKQATWRDMIYHALEKWETATAGMVTMTLEVEPNGNGESQPCANYDGVIQGIEVGVEAALPGSQVDIDVIGDFVEGLSFYANFLREDTERSEIMMVDVVGLKSFGVFPELAETVGFANCVFDETVLGCAVDNIDKTTTDILIRRRAVEPAVQSVVLNRCLTRNVQQESLQLILLHEAGHVLGIKGGREGEGQGKHHPNNSGQTVVHKNASAAINCSPRPLDIMAIHALYQSIP